jgi:phenylacetate-CoA ligase
VRPLSTLGNAARVAAALRAHGRAHRARIEAFQDKRLRALVAHAYENVPFYRELFDRHGVRPHQIRGVADIGRIPIVTKRDLRAAPVGSTVARGYDPARLLTAKTGGFSGEPFEMRRTWLEQRLSHLFRLRAQRQLGKRLGDRHVRLVRERAPQAADNKILGHALRRLGLEYRLTLDVRDPTEVHLRRLKAFRPDVVSGFPNALLHLGERLDSEHRSQIRPRLLMSGAEVLTVSMRTRLRKLWSAPVFETYGSHEFNLIAWECGESEGLHTCDDSVIVEVLQGERPAMPGERGETVITALHLYAMPFIRYRLGDVVTRGPNTCGCGQPFAKIDAIQGRMLDYFRLANGRWLHPSELVVPMMVDGLEWISRYQLVHEREDRIVLRLVPASGATAGRIAEFERAAAEVVGPGVSVQVVIVPEIAPDPGGKFRVSCSLVQSNYDDVDWEHLGPSGRHLSGPGY